MARAQVRVRDAVQADLELLPQWWDDLRSQRVRSGPFAPPALDRRVTERLAALHHDDRHRLLVVEREGAPVGLAVLSIEPVSPLNDACAVQIGFLHVRDGFRRQGAGRALVRAAATLAEEVGAAHVTVTAPPQARDANRFFARLGFSPMVVHRTVATPVLQRRLAGPADSMRRLAVRRRVSGRRVVERVV